MCALVHGRGTGVSAFTISGTGISVVGVVDSSVGGYVGVVDSSVFSEWVFGIDSMGMGVWEYAFLKVQCFGISIWRYEVCGSGSQW